MLTFLTCCWSSFSTLYFIDWLAGYLTVVGSVVDSRLLRFLPPSPRETTAMQNTIIVIIDVFKISLRWVFIVFFGWLFSLGNQMLPLEWIFALRFAISDPRDFFQGKFINSRRTCSFVPTSTRTYAWSVQYFANRFFLMLFWWRVGRCSFWSLTLEM